VREGEAVTATEELARVRVAFIGCGGNARAHVRALLALPEAEVAGLCDVDPAALELTAARIPEVADLPRFTDHREMLDALRPDAVVISTPHTLHAAAAADALDRGVHVQVEKPMACSAAEAKDLLARRDRAGRLLAVGYQRHYEGRYRWLREAVTSGRYGTVHFVEAWQAQDWKGRGWRGVPELSGGGQLNDSGSHLIDSAFWTSGLRPEQVFAFNHHRGRRVDVLSAISFRATNGAVGCLSVVGEHPHGLAEGLQIWCRDARFVLDETGLRMQRVGEDPQPVPAESIADYPSDKDANFVRAVLGREPLQVTGEDGLLVAAFTEAVYAAVREGTPVSVAL
jgi:predicted dehydrogenase